ncbi:hypothetical protein BD311DRAFT_365070 [Dichomitus squalens]|uniref:DUF6534 domain-containing protein n=1 Tax=Dichomitus squalens TaxID=114155 RepID=A0A4Q9ML86_9APHY|nr:hypothetical protein BD311DRAFT_365070 [Dichomitus squalens]
MNTTHNVASLAGPQILGEYLNWGLMGVLCVQVYMYHILFPNDRRSTRAFVYIIFAVEWTQTLIIMDDAFDKYAYNFGGVNKLVELRNAWLSGPLLGGVVGAAVQLFYARRIWVLSKSRLLVGIVSVLSLTQGAAGIAGGVLLKHRSGVQAALKSDKALLGISIWMGGSALADILIAVSMTILLLKSRSGLREMDTIVKKIILLVIESGTLTAAVAVVGVVLFAALPGTIYYEFPAVILAKLYANTMVTSLNNRAFLAIQNQSSATNNGSTKPDTIFNRMFRTTTATDAMATTINSVRVDVLNEAHFDPSFPNYEMDTYTRVRAPLKPHN